jgi:hypothetical protein
MARLYAARHDDSLRIEAVSDPADPDPELYEKGGLLPGPTPRWPLEWLDSERPELA